MFIFFSVKFIFIYLSLILLQTVVLEGARRLRRKTFVITRHDTSVHQFSPKGEIQQIEYANEAVKRGSLLIGVVVKDGVLLMAERAKRSPLFLRQCLPKLNKVGPACGVGLAGLLPDGRMLVQKARAAIQDHWLLYGEEMCIEKLVSVLSQHVQKFHGFEQDDEDEENEGANRDTAPEDEMLSRPVGVAVMIAGKDKRNCCGIYLLEPSGAFIRWRFKAIGFGSELIDLKMAAENWAQLTTVEAQLVLLRILSKHFEENDFSGKELEIMVLKDGVDNPALKTLVVYSDDEVNQCINLLKSTS